MDHLKTSGERKDRWYSKQKARLVEVKDLPHAKEPYPDGIEDHVYGIPCSLLHTDRGSSAISDALESNGFAVITGVLSELDCEKLLGMAWDYIEAASFAEVCCRQHYPTSAPVSRHDEGSHSSKFFPQSLEGGFLPFYGSGHSLFAWTIRDHPNVRLVFERLHSTSNLISSIDGIVLWHQKQPRTDAGWFHLDQNPSAKPGKAGIQGLVNLLPVSEASGGNVMVAKSHKLFPHHYHRTSTDDSERHGCTDFYEQRLKELGNEDWMEIDPNDDILLQKDSIVTCLLKPGSMIVWDSRTVHCSNRGYGNIRDGSTRCETQLEQSAHGLIRAASAVSMMPADSASPTVLKQRELAVKQKRTLTHWTNKVSALGEENIEGTNLEEQRLKYMGDYENLTGKKILLNFDSLSREQLRLVLGDKDYSNYE